jgi:tRNA-dihydrouridine synthase B
MQQGAEHTRQSKAKAVRGPLHLAHATLPNRVFLAPMTGITDLPFRRLASRLGAGLVVSEMIASEALVKERPDMLRRAKGEGIAPYVIQLAGCEAHWLGEGARLAADLGADIIDINMGCPAKEVTRVLSGSALMRDLDHALSLIEAVIAAVPLPVTLKMRLGWDERSLNAPELARRAEAAGVCLVTVHGRTRCQFFKGKANWPAIAEVKRAIGIPVIANGDVTTPEEAKAVLADSGADGLMIGRGAVGAPWLPGYIAARLAGDHATTRPSAVEQRAIVLEHYESMLDHYGVAHGVKIARKHLARYAERANGESKASAIWRKRYLREDDPRKVRAGIDALFDASQERRH